MNLFNNQIQREIFKIWHAKFGVLDVRKMKKKQIMMMQETIKKQMRKKQITMIPKMIMKKKQITMIPKTITRKKQTMMILEMIMRKMKKKSFVHLSNTAHSS